MKRLLGLLVVFSLVALAPHSVDGRTPDRILEDGQMEQVAEDYYPIAIGNTWTYTYAGNLKMVNKVVAHERIGGVMCAKIETSMDGMVLASEHIRVAKDGIYRHSLNGIQPTVPVLILKLPAKTGDQWNIKSKIANETISGKMSLTEETVKVPAGRFKAVVASGKMDAGGQTIGVANYFAKGVGVIKIRMELGGQNIEVELEKFERAK